MKKTILTVVMILGTCAVFAQNRRNVAPGDRGLRREKPPAPLVNRHPDMPPPPGPAHFRTPLAVDFFSLSIPWDVPLEIYGLRLNLTVPFASAEHDTVYGLDIGLSGETRYDVGGIAVNAFDNWSETFTGVGISLVNVVNELHGLHIGLINSAHGGRGIQIGLWNQSDFICSPIIGIVR